jgi:hypothetical protein
MNNMLIAIVQKKIIVREIVRKLLFDKIQNDSTIQTEAPIYALDIKIKRVIEQETQKRPRSTTDLDQSLFSSIVFVNGNKY